MKFVLQTIVISPHQLPLARELIGRLGPDAFRYLYMDELPAERRNMGWCPSEAATWCRRCEKDDRDLETCEVLLSGVRDIALFERRAQKGLKTFYMSERWFKPVMNVRMFGMFECSIPGWVRMLMPSYRRMAKRFVRWMKTDPNARCLTIGPWAKKDMMRLGVSESKIIPWGYFVAPSTHPPKNGQEGVETINQSNNPNNRTILKVLWVGRMLPWKRVDTIVRALRLSSIGRVKQSQNFKIRLTLVGDGPEKSRLQKVAKGLEVTFLPSQPIDKIREIMRDHDVYVLSSNAEEGWGAAVNEALEEGLYVVGTHEAGSSATILSEDDLFHSGDWTALSGKLMNCARQKAAGMLRGQGIGDWSAEKAASRICQLAWEGGGR